MADEKIEVKETPSKPEVVKVEPQQIVEAPKVEQIDAKRIERLEKRVGWLERLVDQLDNLILRNPGFFPIEKGKENESTPE